MRLTGAGREMLRGRSAVFLPRVCSVLSETTRSSPPPPSMHRAKEIFASDQPGLAIFPWEARAS